MPRKTTRTHYTPEQKAQLVVEALREQQTVGQLAAAHGLHPNLLRKWQALALERLPGVFDNERQAQRDLEARHERERQELYAEIGRLTTQLAWLKKKSGLDPTQR